MRPLIELANATIVAPGGRPLFAGLSLRLGRERVALVGRNGVGKSTLLATLAEAHHAHHDGLARAKPEPGRPHPVAGTRPSPKLAYVPQHLPAGARSPGELRQQALRRARKEGAEIVLLDEPTLNLDDEGLAWLRAWVHEFPGAMLVASHDRRLLADFREFFIASESGCRTFSGSLGALDAELEREYQAREVRYLRGLQRLESHEAHLLHVARRKARKKRYGRCSELDRGTPRIRLNQKRHQAQVSHGKLAQQRTQRALAVRACTKTLRRALLPDLPLELCPPTLAPDDGVPLICLSGVKAEANGRTLFSGIDLQVGRNRVAVQGANGSGKTTLLEIMLGARKPSAGLATLSRPRSASVGSIAQGATNWMLDDSLFAWLLGQGGAASPSEVVSIVAAHRFPVALSERPLRSLSPGERTRAALIALFSSQRKVELLILDEPTESLDLVGQRALTHSLRVWPGGLVVASHDRRFLREVGLPEVIDLSRKRACV